MKKKKDELTFSVAVPMSGVREKELSSRWKFRIRQGVKALLDGSVGEADYNVKIAQICGKLDEIKTFSALIHETLHITAPYLTEIAIEKVELALVRVLAKVYWNAVKKTVVYKNGMKCAVCIHFDRCYKKFNRSAFDEVCVHFKEKKGEQKRHSKKVN